MDIADTMKKFHNNECKVYEFFQTNKQTLIPLPEIYFIQQINIEENKGGIIIMEDLSEKAFTISFIDGLNEQQV